MTFLVLFYHPSICSIHILIGITSCECSTRLQPLGVALNLLFFQEMIFMSAL